MNCDRSFPVSGKKVVGDVSDTAFNLEPGAKLVIKPGSVVERCMFCVPPTAGVYAVLCTFNDCEFFPSLKGFVL